MKKVKRILAWIAIVLLFGMYVVTAVMAFTATPNTVQMFKTSLIATIMIPVMVYVVFFLYRLIHPEEPVGEADLLLQEHEREMEEHLERDMEKTEETTGGMGKETVGAEVDTAGGNKENRRK